MSSGILFAGGEDMDFAIYTGLVAVGTAGVSINTTAGYFRSGYARYALTNLSNTNPVLTNTFFFATQPWVGTTATTFWSSAQYSMFITSGTLSNTNAGIAMWWLSSDNVIRLRIRNPSSTGVGALPPVACNVEKVNAAGTVTLLGTTSAMFSQGSLAKIDVYINYAVAGQISIYQNGSRVFNYTGDVTTDGVTALAQLRLGSVAQIALGNAYSAWSEVIVSTRDTRAMSLITQAPSAAGTTTSWTGTAAQVNANTASDANPNYTGTAAAVQQYTATAVPSGAYGILTAITTLRAAGGSTGPQNIQANVRTGGVDYFGSTSALDLSWQRITYAWDTNPGTAAAWTIADLNAAGFNMGFKSIA